MADQKKRHKITIEEVKQHLRMMQGKPITILEYRWYEFQGEEALFVLFKCLHGNELRKLGQKWQIRWSVFVNGKPDAGGIVG